MCVTLKKWNEYKKKVDLKSTIHLSKKLLYFLQWKPFKTDEINASYFVLKALSFSR